jgi:hypothetical protein
MRKRLLIVAAAAMLVAGLAVPLAASQGLAAKEKDGRVTIGVRLDFTSETHAEGSFAVCCTITDAGTASADITAFEPEGDQARFEATNTFVGANGSFTITLRGRTGPLGSPVHVAGATWKVTGGTGAYAGLRGGGIVSAVTDQNTGALTAVDTGKVRLP